MVGPSYCLQIWFENADLIVTVFFNSVSTFKEGQPWNQAPQNYMFRPILSPWLTKLDFQTHIFKRVWSPHKGKWVPKSHCFLTYTFNLTITTYRNVMKPQTGPYYNFACLLLQQFCRQYEEKSDGPRPLPKSIYIHSYILIT